MQARMNAPIAGRNWIKEGWRLFRLEPVGFIILLFTYLFGMLVLSLLLSLLARALGEVLPALLAETIGDLGSLLVAALVPGISVGFMEACRLAESKQPIHPRLLVQAFIGDPLRARQLLMLGAVYSLAFAAILGAVSSFGLPAMPTAGPDGTPQAVELPPGALSQTLFVIGAAMLAYVPVAMALWFSPVLVTWHGMPAVKAMFYSFAACWRNRAAFMIYALLWTGLAFAIPALGVALRLLGLGSASVLVMMPLMGLFMGWLYCSFYATYKGVWLGDEEAL